MQRDQLQIEGVLAALGHPVRLGIVRELAASPDARTCGSLPLDITKATATFHWRVLRESGITREQKQGRYRWWNSAATTSRPASPVSLARS